MNTQRIILDFSGYDVQLTFRKTDEEAADRGEPVYFERFETNCGVRITFDMPKDAAALRKLLTTGSFLHFDPVMNVRAEKVKSNARGFGHDVIRGVLTKLETWEPVEQLPEDWPAEEPEDEGEENDDEYDCGPLLNEGGLACGGQALLSAEATTADGQKLRLDFEAQPIKATELVKHWPWLETFLDGTKLQNTGGN